MRITKVYTRTGDQGQTRLVGNQVVPKDHPRIEAYGTVDELNALIGMGRATYATSGAPDATRTTVDVLLGEIQNDLFNVGTDLATREADRWEGMHRVGDEEVARLERWIDELNGELPPLKEFILPGGGLTGTVLHQARTVCRRAERRVFTLMRTEPEVEAGPMRYLNRLSDLLFVLSRWVARGAGEPETYWKNPSKRSRSS